jgi:hypothetical protein
MRLGWRAEEGSMSRRRRIARHARAGALGLAIAGLALSVSFPRFPARTRPGANASAAVATLQRLVDAQRSWRAAGVIDRDEDGLGECGFFDELAAGDAARGLGPLLSSAFAKVDAGVLQRSGYAFRVLLRGAEGSWHAQRSAAIDPDAAERGFRAQAWPLEPSVVPVVFAVDEAGVLWRWNDASGRHRGLASPPPLDLGLALIAPEAERSLDRDGRVWERVR